MRKGRRAVGLLALAVVLAVSLTAIAVAADRWTDITDQQWVTYYGVTATQAATVAQGYPDGTFRPTITVNREQFSKMAVDGLDLELLDPATPSFSDVPRGSQYYEYIEGAVNAKIILGYPDGTFRPTNLITREQANSMMGRALSDAELAAQGSILGTVGNYPTLAAWYLAEGDFYLGAYSDSSQVAVAHRPATAYLIYHEVVLGSNGHLDPKGYLSRAQAVAMVLRTVDAIAVVMQVTPPAPPTDMTTTPLSPSTDKRPLISGKTVLVNADVVVYDTFGSATTELAQGLTDSSGEFVLRVPSNKLLAEGLHSFTARVKDSRGHASDPSSAVPYRVDTTAPVASVTQPANNAAISDPKPVFKVDASDLNGSGVAQVVFQYAVDVSAPVYTVISTDATVPYEAQWPTTGLPNDNEYLLRAQVTDLAGNQTTAGPVAVILDRIVPTAAITYIEHSQENLGVLFTSSHTPDFSANAGDPAPSSGGPASGVAHVDFYYALKSGVPSDPTTTAGFTLISSDVAPGYGASWGSRSLANGDYLLAVRSFDRAGNASLIDTREVVVGSPAITSLNPTMGPLAGGDLMTIKGTNLVGVTTVHFGAKAVTAHVEDATVTCIIPSLGGAEDATVAVTVVSPGGTSNALTYSYKALPTISSLSPDSGSALGGTAVTIHGTHLALATKVNFGATAVTAHVEDATTVTCTSPSLGYTSDATVPVTVTTPAGSSNALDFHFFSV
jgi:hypothetical protein